MLSALVALIPSCHPTTNRATLATAPYFTRKDFHEVLQSSLTLAPILFLNEVCPRTAAPRREASGEAASAHSRRQISAALAFFGSLLREDRGTGTASACRVLLLVADEEDRLLSCPETSSSGMCTSGHPVSCTMDHFVKAVCGPRTSAVGDGSLWDLLDSAASVPDPIPQSKLPPLLPAHLSPQELSRGLQGEGLVSGELNVFPFNTQQAEVLLDGEGGHSILVSGMTHRNRALQGDKVVIQVRWEVGVTLSSLAAIFDHHHQHQREEV